jgi:hypothetical protein
MSLDVTSESQKKEKQYTTDIKILNKLSAENIRPFSSEIENSMTDLLRLILHIHHDITVHLIISSFRLKKTERMRYLYFDLGYAISTLYSDKQLL